MDNTMDYFQKLRDDLLEQFKGKPNIEVFQEALSRQLLEFYEFLYQLYALRWLQTSEGVQLDGIGNIVVMSRADALVVSKLAEQGVPMDDETYRLYLAWKKNLNATNCTNTDVYRALKMFWDKTPLYYSENPAYPATMFYSAPAQDPDAELIDFSILAIAPKIKAAGVSMIIVVPIDRISFINENRFNFIDFDVQFGITNILGKLKFWQFDFSAGIVKNRNSLTGKITMDNRWFFNGTYKFDGTRKFNSFYIEEEL